jgi:hypothetical protein
LAHVLEPPALPRRTSPAGNPSAASPGSDPRELVARAPFPLARAQSDRAQLWVRLTLFVAVLALLIYSIALPMPGPRRDVATAERRFVEVRLVLSEIRAVLADFRADHGVWPGQGRNGVGDPGLLTDQLTQPTTRNGALLADAPATQKPEPVLGPYHHAGVPANPINGLRSVRFLRPDEPWPSEADGLTGWLYRPASGEIRANLPGSAFASAPRYLDL